MHIYTLGIQNLSNYLKKRKILTPTISIFFSTNNPKEWNVGFGLLLSDLRTQRSIRNIIIHEDYHYPAHDNDIAVVNLSSPVLYTSKIRRACLPEATYTFPPNADVVVTGWGTLKSDGEFLTSFITQFKF